MQSFVAYNTYVSIVLKIIYKSICILRLEKKLKSIERQQKIQQRWVPESPEYQYVNQLVIEKQKRDILGQLNQCARERWYMLKVKAKFAGIHICTVMYICINVLYVRMHM